MKWEGKGGRGALLSYAMLPLPQLAPCLFSNCCCSPLPSHTHHPYNDIDMLASLATHN